MKDPLEAEAELPRWLFWLVVALVFFLAALATSWPALAAERRFSGIASFYGNESGTRTASGARFDESKMTCAHRSLPFGTRLRVTFRGAAVVCLVNDRGPFIAGRVLDLSKGAARAIGITGRIGLAFITAEIL